MHCILYYVDRSASAVHHRNDLLSEESDCWFGNVLLAWANNDWPHDIQLGADVVLDVLRRS